MRSPVETLIAARTHGIAHLLLLVAAFGATAPGCRKQTSPRCRLPSATLERLRQQGDDPPLTSAQRERQIREMVDRCGGLPSDAKAMLLGAFLSPEERAVALAKGLENKAWSRRLERLCPGFGKLLDELPAMAPEEREAALHKTCRVERHGLMSQREFRIAPIENLNAIAVYEILREGGVEQRAARALARLLMGRGHLQIARKEGEMILPNSTARTVATAHLVLAVTASSVLVNDRAVVNVRAGGVDPGSKPDGPQGYVVTPLLKILRERAARPARGSQGRAAPGPLAVAVHKGTPFRLVNEVLHTAHLAGFRFFELVVDGHSIWDRALPLQVGVGAEPPAASARLEATREAFTLTLGAGGPRKAVVAGGGSMAKRLGALTGFLAAQASRIPRADGWGIVHVKVDDTMRFDRVVALLDALRQKPGTPADGCRLTFDAAAAGWKLAEGKGEGCLLPRLRIHVGPAPGSSAPAPTPARAPAKAP